MTEKNESRYVKLLEGLSKTLDEAGNGFTNTQKYALVKFVGIMEESISKEFYMATCEAIKNQKKLDAQQAKLQLSESTKKNEAELTSKVNEMFAKKVASIKEEIPNVVDYFKMKKLMEAVEAVKDAISYSSEEEVAKAKKSYEEEIKKLENELAKAKDDSTKATTDLVANSTTILKNKDLALQNQKEQLDSMDKELKKNVEVINQQEQDISSKVEEISKMKGVVESFKKELDSSMKKIDDLSKKAAMVESLSKEKETLQAQILKLTKVNENLEKQHKETVISQHLEKKLINLPKYEASLIRKELKDAKTIAEIDESFEKALQNVRSIRSSATLPRTSNISICETKAPEAKQTNPTTTQVAESSFDSPDDDGMTIVEEEEEEGGIPREEMARMVQGMGYFD